MKSNCSEALSENLKRTLTRVKGKEKMVRISEGGQGQVPQVHTTKYILQKLAAN